jgi:hypothetical protein
LFGWVLDDQVGQKLRRRAGAPEGVQEHQRQHGEPAGSDEKQAKQAVVEHGDPFLVVD